KVEVTPPPSLQKVYAKKVVLYGRFFDSQYRNQIRLEALKHNLHGYIKKSSENSIELLVGSENTANIESFVSECHQLSENVTIQRVNETEWDKPLEIGFKKWQEARSELKYSIKKISNANQQLENEIKELKIKNKNLLQNQNDLNQEKGKLAQDITGLNSEIKRIKENYNKIKRKQDKLLK